MSKTLRHNDTNVNINTGVDVHPVSIAIDGVNIWGHTIHVRPHNPERNSQCVEVRDDTGVYVVKTFVPPWFARRIEVEAKRHDLYEN